MVGEKSHKNQRRSTLHSPNPKAKITCRRGTRATPDTSGLRPLPRPVRRAKERGQNSIRGMCCARLKFQGKSDGRLALIFCGTKNYKSSVRLSVCFCISIFNFLIETLIPTGSGRKAFFPTPLTMVDPRPCRYKAPAQDMGIPEAGRCLCTSYVKVSANSDKYSMRKHHCNNQPRKNTNKMVQKRPLTRCDTVRATANQIPQNRRVTRPRHRLTCFYG